MDLLIDAQLPGALRTGGWGFPPRWFALPAPGPGQLRGGRRLVLLFDLLTSLTKHINLPRQCFLQDLFEIFTKMPPVKHLFGVRGSFVRSLEITCSAITANDLHSRMFPKPRSE